MADNSAIEWTEATWNPVTGCSKVSPGCAHCYAERLSLRFPTRDTSPPRELAPGVYSVTVTNPDGRSASLPSALTVVPPPSINAFAFTTAVTR